MSKRVELFMQVADARLQKRLEQLLEDTSSELGLTSNWKLVLNAVSMIVKWQMRVDKLIVADSSETSENEINDKPATSKHKLEEPILDDLVKELEEISQNRLQSGIDFVKVHSIDVYEMLLQLKKGFEDMIEVQVETKYKTVAKKVKSVATPLPKGSNEVIEESSHQPMLRDSKNIEHKFIEETLKQLKIDEDGFLSDEEIKCFQEGG
ncbi:hypothetical protein L7F22_038188 [Adiantum nelumboides]|nr:hypothetical protein [Adiantum nelumboides]